VFSFEIDPHQVLGIGPQASLEEIRDAYRNKAKKYHPDKGGEDWSFRILSQAYEMLSSQRVLRATRVEPPPAQAPDAARAARPRPERGAESVHAGIHDRGVDPARMVAVELLCVRYLWDDAEYLWLTQAAPDADRFLSCNLNITWPDRGPTNPAAAAQDAAPISTPDSPAITTTLQEIFDHLIITTRVVASRSRVQEDRFAGWLSYSNFDRAWKCVNTLHELARSRGLGLRQWSRDLFIPRGWS
jgi:hypothetical protein